MAANCKVQLQSGLTPLIDALAYFTAVALIAMGNSEEVEYRNAQHTNRKMKFCPLNWIRVESAICTLRERTKLESWFTRHVDLFRESTCYVWLISQLVSAMQPSYLPNLFVTGKHFGRIWNPPDWTEWPEKAISWCVAPRTNHRVPAANLEPVE